MIITVTLNPALDKTLTIPHFAPGVVNRVGTVRRDPGGKGINVSRWAHVLGGDTVAMGILGGDTGRYIEWALKQQGVAASFVWSGAETRTNVKVVDPEAGTTTDINEPGEPVDAEILGHVYDALANRVRPGDIAVLAGRLPKGVPTAVLPDWTAALTDRGARVYADVEGDALAAILLATPYLLKPNLEELSAYLGRSITELDDIADAARTLQAGGVQRVVVSMGARGAIFAGEGAVLYARGLDIPVGSTVGAGDATVAALAVAQQQGLPMEETARLAIAAGAASAMQPGTQTAPLSLVESLMEKVVVQTL